MLSSKYWTSFYYTLLIKDCSGNISYDLSTKLEKYAGYDKNAIMEPLELQEDIQLRRIVNVVAGIIENERNEILCALRSPVMSLPNRWEFPGGKIEAAENAFEALEREIMEELGCQITATEFFHENTHEYDSFIIKLTCLKATIITDTPKAKEHSKLIWLKRENLEALKWAPADIPAVHKLINE